MSEIQDIVELKLSVKSPTPNFPYNDDAGNHDPGFPTICYFTFKCLPQSSTPDYHSPQYMSARYLDLMTHNAL